MVSWFILRRTLARPLSAGVPPVDSGSVTSRQTLERDDATATIDSDAIDKNIYNVETCNRRLRLALQQHEHTQLSLPLTARPQHGGPGTQGSTPPGRWLFIGDAIFCNPPAFLQSTSSRSNLPFGHSLKYDRALKRCGHYLPRSPPPSRGHARCTLQCMASQRTGTVGLQFYLHTRAPVIRFAGGRRRAGGRAQKNHCCTLELRISRVHVYT